MFWRMVRGTLFRQKSKMLMIAFTVALGVSLATAMMNVMLGVGDKVNKELKTYGANITVMHKDASILDDLYGLSGEGVSNKFLSESEVTKIKQIFWGFAIVDFAPYLERSGEIEGVTNKVKIYGTWFEKHLVMPTGEEVDAGIKNLKTWWEVKGEWLKDDDLEGVMVGSLIAGKNNIKIGDTINVKGTNETKKLIVRGIFKTGFLDYDANLIIIPLKTMQILGEQGEVATEIGIKTGNPQKIEEVEAEVHGKLQNDNFSIVSWKTINQNLLSAVHFEKFVLIAILSLLLMVACFAVSVILNMIVREKIKDIGILKSIGYTNSHIRNIFTIEGLIIGVSGMILASIFSPVILLVLKQLFKMYLGNSYYYLEELPLYISVKELLIIYIVAFAVVFISTIYPAARAAKMKPVEALKYE